MRYRLVDAFTDRPFTGNPAAVFLLDRPGWPDASWMQLIAPELSVSETAFAHPLPASADADWALRWFTPLVEDELCGHATLATAHALHTDRGHAGTVRFRTRSGVLLARTDDAGTVTLDFPRPVLSQITPPEGLREALGVEPEQVYDTGSLGDLLAIFDSERTVRGIKPDFGGLTGLQARTSRPDRGVIVTAPADIATPRPRLRLTLLHSRSRHRGRPGDRQRAYRPRALLVSAAGSTGPDGPAGLATDRHRHDRDQTRQGRADRQSRHRVGGEPSPQPLVAEVPPPRQQALSVAVREPRDHHRDTVH